MGHPRDYFMETARLGFDCWSNHDLLLANTLWGDSLTTGLIGGPFTAEQVLERLRAEIASMAAHGVQYWPIFLLDSGSHVGCAGLRPRRIEDKIYELGFHLRPQYWRRGLAQEAARAVVKYGFEALGAKALFAGHHPANAASGHLLMKLGFRFIGDEFYVPTGLMRPSYTLARPL